MERGKLAQKIVTKSTDHFDLTGMISPGFVNNGETTAIIFGQPIPPFSSSPMGQFSFFHPSLILEGSIPIKFIDEPGKKNLVNVYYGTLINCN